MTFTSYFPASNKLALLPEWEAQGTEALKNEAKELIELTRMAEILG